jgi:hypothetical protein
LLLAISLNWFIRNKDLAGCILVENNMQKQKDVYPIKEESSSDDSGECKHPFDLFQQWLHSDI